MKCSVCGKNGFPLFRVNPIGEVPAVWAHAGCHPRPNEIDQETRDLVNAIQIDGAVADDKEGG